MPSGVGSCSWVALIAGTAIGMAVPCLTSPVGPGFPGTPVPASLTRTVTGPPPATTPHFPVRTRPTEQIRQLAACGNTMYAVGTFTTIQQGSRQYARDNAFSFALTAPYTVTSWHPKVNGEVDSIAFVGGNCADAYIGGKFTAVSGTPVANIAEVATTGSGPVVNQFAHSANGQIETLAAYQDNLLAGGYFTSINGAQVRYLASLYPSSGVPNQLIRLNIHGSISFPGAVPNVTRVFNQQISHSGSLDLVEGDFTSVGGQPRRQIFMLNLASRPGATVTGWTSPEWDGSLGYPPRGYYYNCTGKEPYYIRAAAWSPDDRTIYLASTGYRPWNYLGAYPLKGLCDMAAAFSASYPDPAQKWINYDGCYTLLSVTADQNTAFFAGHELWSDRPGGCKGRGSGGTPAAGFEGLSPDSGRLIFNPTRSRGIGADSMLLTANGLWIASDNSRGAQDCDYVANLAGLCFLPYQSG